MKFLGFLSFTLPVCASAALAPVTVFPSAVSKIVVSKIVVAVIDTGLDTRHPVVRDHLWTNPGESGRDPLGRDKSINGVDDDGNGFVDDVHGWNFVNDSPIVDDRHGHGTHVAGLVIGDPVDSPVEIMALKYFDTGTSEQSNLVNTVRAIHYAVQMKANIVNYSGGGATPSWAERSAIREAEERGQIFVAAAGNGRTNSDLRPFYPADYGLSNVISVAAHGGNSRLLTSSNFGERTVDIVAPGEAMLSALPGGAYGRMTGTSQATAVVSGAVARWLSLDHGLRTPKQVIARLVRTGIPEADLVGRTKYGVRLNAAPVARLLE